MEDAKTRPKELKWFRIYSAVMAVLMAVSVLIYAVTISTTGMFSSIGAAEGAIMAVIFGMVIAIGAAHLAVLRVPRKRWGWIYCLIIAGLGLGQCLPLGIVFLIFLTRPHVREYFEEA